MVLSIIMSYQIQDTYSTSFDTLKKDFKLQSDEYLKYLNIAYKLEKRVLLHWLKREEEEEAQE